MSTHDELAGRVWASAHLTGSFRLITSGGQVIESAESLRSLGATIDHALCVVDRQAGGRQTLAGCRIDLTALFTLDEVKRAGGVRSGPLTDR
jgi:hypothetical protein